MTTAVDDVTSRLAEIQSRIASLSSGPDNSVGTAPGAAGDFSSVLASFLSPSDPSATADTSGLSALSGSPSDPAGTTSGAAVVNAASKYLGVPYAWGGTNPATGLDCSGLVQRTYADLGIALPRVASDQARMGTPVANLSQAQPGDLVAFGSPVDHIGIYAGGGKMVVAPHRGTTVRIEDITMTPTAIRRIVSDPTAGIAGIAGLGGTSSLGSLAATATSSAGGQSPYADLFSAAGARYGVDPRVLSAVAKAESGYNPNAASPAGAQGLMQLMPSTASSLGVNPMDPAQAIDGAARLLAGHLQRFGRLDLALAAYNAGGTAVARAGGIPPYPETQAYVKRVLNYVKESNL
jgi:peptidoglycan DL-endopeptidase CwlO